MNYTIVKKLPPVEEVIQEFPASTAAQEKIARDITEVKNILSGKDKRLLIIVGPCSAWPKPAVMEYAARLKSLSEKIKGRLKLVMRVYIQKPRTTKGWTGPVNQPDPLGYPDIEAGVKYTRAMMVKVIEMGLPWCSTLLRIYTFWWGKIASYFLGNFWLLLLKLCKICSKCFW